MIHLVATSNLLAPARKSRVDNLVAALSTRGHQVTQADGLLSRTDASAIASPAEQRSKEILGALAAGKTVLDLSGGNYANEVLNLVVPALASTPFPTLMGYSDLTCLLVPLAQFQPTIWYQALHATDPQGRAAAFFDLLAGRSHRLLEPQVYQLRGEHKPIEGVVIGGNLRCLLKLAGTPYFPDLRNKILFLEARTCDPAALIPQLAQLQQMRVLDQARALLLGTFTTFEKEHSLSELLNIFSGFLPPQLPIFRSDELGHAPDAAGLALGACYRLSNGTKMAFQGVHRLSLG